MNQRRLRGPVLIAVVAAVLAIAGAALLVNIVQRQQEARNPFYRVVDLDDEIDDPAVWGKNFPLQYDGYRRTVDQIRTRYGGSEAVPLTPTNVDPRSIVAQSRLEEDPRLKTLWAGYAFAARVLALSLDETRRGQASLPGSVSRAGAAPTVRAEAPQK